MDWTLLTIHILEALKTVGGSWGMAIILLTIIVRSALIPLSVSQQRSMKKMQELSPKLKQLQSKYKDKPQELQQKMMEFYKENKFNPLGGCFPLLLQMPVFILLYTTLISPVFLQKAGPESFLFIHRLDGTLQSYSGKIDDGVFNVKEKDTFISGKYNVIAYLDDGTSAEGQIKNYRKALTFSPKPLEPGKDVTFTLKLSEISFEEQKVNPAKIVSAKVPVVDNNSKEIEHIKFTLDKTKGVLTGKAETVLGKGKLNIGVLILLLLFGFTMWGSTKLMSSMSSSAALDPQQKAMQESMSKMMPFMIMAMFVIIPIPAGVLLYMVASNIFQVGQTFAINKYLENQKIKEKAQRHKDDVIDVTAETKTDKIEDDKESDPILLGTDKHESPVKKPSDEKLSRKKRKRKGKKKFK